MRDMIQEKLVIRSFCFFIVCVFEESFFYVLNIYYLFLNNVYFIFCYVFLSCYINFIFLIYKFYYKI